MMTKLKADLDFRFPLLKSATDPFSNLIIGHWNRLSVYTLLQHHSIIFSKLGACAETISTWFMVLFTISRFLIFKLATDPLFNRKFSICWNWAGHRFQRVEIWSVADFGDGNRKSERALKEVFTKNNLIWLILAWVAF